MQELEVSMKIHNIQFNSSTFSTSSKPHAISTIVCQPYHEWILDSYVSHHMTNCRDLFSSIDDWTSTQSFVNDISLLDVVGIGKIQRPGGKFSKTFYVHDFSTNLLSIFQIPHFGDGKIIKYYLMMS